MRQLWFVLAGSLWLASCATSTRPPDPSQDEDESVAQEFEQNEGLDGKSRTEGSASVTYARTAAENWKRGEAAFADEDYQAAQKFYAYIRSKFPYSGLAVRAELRIADCLFARERYLEAIDAYSNFQRLHPTHKDVGYAAYRVGASYSAQIPGDWFFLPASYEKDQAAIRDAARALRAYVDKFPSDPRHADGVKLLNDVKRRLVRHERMVADFYRRIERPKAYAARLEVIHREYGDIAIDADLLVEMIEVYAELGEKQKAQARLQELETKFPSAEQLGHARELARGGS